MAAKIGTDSKPLPSTTRPKPPLVPSCLNRHNVSARFDGRCQVRMAERSNRKELHGDRRALSTLRELD